MFVRYSDSVYRQLVGLLIATKTDLESGILGNLEHRVRKVEIDSLLDYSFQLLDEKDDTLDRYACVLARVVLEKSLQLLCDKHSLDSSQKADIMNQQLWDKAVYPKPTWRAVKSMFDVGNAAAHPDAGWEGIKENERRRMVSNVETFMKDHL
jgi:hypothetical protein